MIVFLRIEITGVLPEDTEEVLGDPNTTLNNLEIMENLVKSQKPGIKGFSLNSFLQFKPRVQISELYTIWVCIKAPGRILSYCLSLVNVYYIYL